jgi:retron-type reverse transcriptase
MGKRYRAYAIAFDDKLEENLLQLQRELLTRTYRPAPYRIFRIWDPKPRVIAAPGFRDRVVHHAFCVVVEPLLERSFVADSYACRVGKGTHKAMDRCQEFTRRFRYVLQCDIEKYFMSIDHQILKKKIRRHVADDQVLWLADTILDKAPVEPVTAPHYYPGDDLLTPVERRRGIPIGSLTSQLFANLYLDPLDHFVKECLRVKGYVRYMDDFLLFAESKEALAASRVRLREFLQGLRLHMHRGKQEIYPVRCGVPFLGFTIFPDRRRIRRQNVTRFLRRMIKKREAVRRGLLTEDEFRRSLVAWVAHARHGDTWMLRKALFRRLWSRNSPVGTSCP